MMTRILAMTFLFAALIGLAQAAPPPCATIGIDSGTAGNTLPAGQVGVAYSQTLTASGGAGGFGYQITSGLPVGTGLSMNGGTGVLSGTPTQAATYFLTITGRDSNGCTGGRTYVLDILADSTTNLISTVNPSVFGQSTTFTATVTSSVAGTPTGTVTFFDGATNIGSNALDGSAQASISVSNLSVGSHSITAQYAGDATYGASTSSPLTQTVNQAATTTAVVADSDPSTFGQNVQFTATVSASLPGAGTPTGSVDFFDGALLLGSGTLSGGNAIFNTTALSVGGSPHSITAQYNGDTNFTGSISSALSHTVNMANTTTSVTSDVNPSVLGQNVTFTATVAAVSPGAGTPTGSVNFLDGATVIGSGALSAGQATFSTSSLSVGPHPIIAVYTASSDFNGSSSSTYGQTVNPEGTTTTLASDSNPSVFGENVTFTATVTPSGAGTPTGTVSFFDGVTLLSAVAMVGNQATLQTTALALGGHTITATYNGDSNFGSSTSAPLTQTVNQADTTTTATADFNPSVFGQNVTFTATVAAASPGSGTPTGTVTFKEGATDLSGPVLLDGSGQATFPISTLAVGSHDITVIYSGDTNFLPSDNTASPLTQVVGQASTTTTLGTSGSPSVFGQSVTFTATVAAVAPGGGTPTGTVTFKDGATTLGPGTLSGGIATFTTSSLSVATHSITADYAGTTSYAASSTAAPTSQVVNKADTTTTVVSNLNPSTFGQSVTFTATVAATAPGAGSPTGSVTFVDTTTSTTLGTVALSSGQAAVSTSALDSGVHSISATYAGDTDFNGSSGNVSQTVNPLATTTVLGSAPNPSTYQQSVTFTATVTASTGTPTGTVTFFDGATNVGSAPLSGGVATLPLSTLTAAASPHSMTAQYGGATNYATSTSTAITQTVNKADQTISFSTSAPAFGSASASATPHTYPAAAIATSGLTVTFSTSGACSNAGGTVTFGPGAGTCTISADQAGDGNWNAAPQLQQSTTVEIPASAVGDSHNVTGNVAIAAGTSVMNNDTGTSIAIKSYGATTGSEQTSIGTATATAQGGSVTLIAVGTYDYDPPANFTGTDTFKYIIGNDLAATSTGTVTLTVTDRIIVVSTGGGGTCKPVTPSPCTLAVADGAAAASGIDLVFVESGSYSPSAAISLNANQKLVGNGPLVGLAQAVTDAGITLAPESATLATISPGTIPTLSNSNNVITLGGGNLVEYFSITNSAGSAIAGPSTGAGTSSIHDIAVTNGAVAGNGVNITANVGTLNFSNIAIATTTGTAFAATGGGTVNAMQNNASIVNTLNATSGTALNVTNTTIGASGLTFRSISSGTAVNSSPTGIILDTTGATAGLTVTGNSAGLCGGAVPAFVADSWPAPTAANTADCTGGVIQHKTGADGATTTGNGIYLNNTSNVSLTRMYVHDVQNHGIRGFNVNGFTLTSSFVSGINGTSTAFDSYGEHSVGFGDDASAATNGLIGTASVTNSRIEGGTSRNFSVVNTGGSLNRLTITGTTFGLTAPGNGNQNLAVEARRPLSGANTTANVTVTNCVFLGSAADAANFTGQEPTTALTVNMDVIFQHNIISNTHPNNNIGGNGITVAGFTNQTFNVSNNNIRDSNGSGMTLQLGAPIAGSTVATSLDGTIANNFIGANGVVGSGSKTGNAIFFSFADNTTNPRGVVTVRVDSNTIRNYSGNAGLYADNTGGNYDMNTTVTNNVITQPGPLAFAGIAMTAGAPPPATDSIANCLNMSGNNASGGDPSNSNDIIIGGGSSGASFIRQPGEAAPFTQAGVQAYVLSQNNFAGTVVNAYTDGASFASTFQGGGAACALPTH